MNLILGSLGYPFQKENRGFLLWGAILFTLPPVIYSILPSLPYVGLIAEIAESSIFCYMMIFFQSVLETATREDERLEWPEISDAQSMTAEVLQIVIPIVVSFLPVIALFVYWAISGAYSGKDGSFVTLHRAFVFGGAIVWGILYLPMALLAYSFYGQLAVVQFWAIFAAIGRVWADYWKVVVLLVGLFLLHGGLAAWVSRWPLPIAAPIVALAFYYTMVAGVRAIGLIYRRNREQLGWDS